MNPKIHPTAIIDPTAQIGTGVEIGPYTIIGPNCVIGERSVLAPHVVIEKNTKLGTDCRVSSGAILGGAPQDYGFKEETSWVEIGNGTVIREYATIHRASGEGQVTRVGDNSMIMASAHVAHNCQLGNHVTLANNVLLAGYVEIGDNVFMSAMCIVHQFVKIGRLAFVAGFSGTRQDIPPFAMTVGRPQAVVKGVNTVGLKRNGFSLAERSALKRAYHELFFTALTVEEAIALLNEEYADIACVQELIAFVRESKRGIHRPGAQLADTSLGLDDSSSNNLEEVGV